MTDKVNELGKYLHGLAEVQRAYNAELCRGLHWAGDAVVAIDTALPSTGLCDECGGRSNVIERFCSSSQEFRAGWRTLWRCEKCGEMEIR